MTELYLTKGDTWYGGFYELALEIGETSDKQLGDTLQAIWSHPSVHIPPQYTTGGEVQWEESLVPFQSLLKQS